MNYEDMSDFEINKLVAGKAFGSHEWVCVSSWSDDEFVASLINHTQEKFDPCNNPSDAWPIILTTGMSIELAHEDLGGIGTCTIYNSMGTDWYCDFTDNSKALRAAMICFLKMKDSE
ncbi:NinX [Vibrio phage 1.186.O._10N.286.49.E3]|nr:NinX [Vibrio phage 1.186.O._10N.286.49.E3]